jgi:transposase
MALDPSERNGQRLRKRIARHRDALFVFVTARDVPYTNNACERALRPSVIFRKVTNGFRSEWGARFFADLRSVVNTGALNGVSPLKAIQDALETDPSPQTA